MMQIKRKIAPLTKKNKTKKQEKQKTAGPLKAKDMTTVVGRLLEAWVIGE